jgi:hypothetical protein
MTMSTMTVGLDHPSHMLIVPAAGFPEIISPFWREEELLRSAEIDGQRRWRAELDGRNNGRLT